MSDIDYQDKGSLLNPLRALAFFGRRPVTEPLRPRRASLNYRGFHLNDWEQCIGCGTCQKVCDNAAITMIKVPGLVNDPAHGRRDLRPAIDYGRCCWCALCVDLCPTGSITLSREYVHTCDGNQTDSYFILPDPMGIHRQFLGQGWQKTPDTDLLDLRRRPTDTLLPEARIGNFDEIAAGYPADQAYMEASRCVQCGLCHDACPTHMHAPEYIRALWNGDPEEAVRQIYRTNPFAHTCGRICTHRCETACSVGRRGDPIAIRGLKRYALDAVGLERVKEIAAEGKADYLTGKRVAIVGAGPAGLTAAYDLVKQGHTVTVFEAQPQAGGMTRYGIPDYRLPAALLDRDLEVISSLGVEIRYGTRVGRDIALEQLRQDHDAVLIASGLQLGRSTRIPGSDRPGVEKAVDLLRWMATGDAPPAPPSAVVIGGGNVAMDTARTLARLQRQTYGEVRVTVTALEAFAHFLADLEEVREAREEGIEILDARAPREVVLENGRVVGLTTWRVLSIFDSQGRFSPTCDGGDERFHPGVMIVEAIGQMSDLGLLGPILTEALEWNRGRLAVSAEGRTSQPWLWAAGDLVRGPDVVNAVADGHRVAASIHACL